MLRKFAFSALLTAGCVSLTALTGSINDRGSKAEQEFNQHKRSRISALRCAKAASSSITEARQSRIWPGWLSNGQAGKILSNLDGECSDGDTGRDMGLGHEDQERSRDAGQTTGQAGQDGSIRG